MNKGRFFLIGFLVYFAFLFALGLLVVRCARADVYSPNGFWPTGILDPACPGQYAYRIEPGHAFMFCWGHR
jgi:hypothetical protein